MNEETGADYLTPWQLSECVDGAGLGVVESSRCGALKRADLVTFLNWPWQTQAVLKGTALHKVRPVCCARSCVGGFLGGPFCLCPTG